MTQEITKKTEKTKDTSVETIISQAVQSGASIETLERLMTMREKFKAEQAREAFVTAMSGFQSECPVIEKTQKVLNKDGKSVRYTFAPLGSIVKQIQKPLAKYELAYTWDVKNEPGFITAIATVTHALGHSKTSEFKIPIDTEGYMTAPQKYASALTFAKRYSLCNALGISTGEEDTDATDVNKEKTPKSLKSKVMFLLKQLGKETGAKEVIKDEVMKLTQLELNETNLEEIVSRLEVCVIEKNNEDPTIQ